MGHYVKKEQNIGMMILQFRKLGRAQSLLFTVKPINKIIELPKKINRFMSKLEKCGFVEKFQYLNNSKFKY